MHVYTSIPSSAKKPFCASRSGALRSGALIHAHTNKVNDSRQVAARCRAAAAGGFRCSLKVGRYEATAKADYFIGPAVGKSMRSSWLLSIGL